MRQFSAESDITAWVIGCALNPARIEPSQRNEPAVHSAVTRVGNVEERGLNRMAELAHGVS